MFGTIIITFVITALSITAVYLLYLIKQKDASLSKLRREINDLWKRINNYEAKEQQSREDKAYNDGLYAGRKTDTLWRQTLSHIEKGKQATVMMYGENYQEENDE